MFFNWNWEFASQIFCNNHGAIARTVVVFQTLINCLYIMERIDVASIVEQFADDAGGMPSTMQILP